MKAPLRRPPPPRESYLKERSTSPFKTKKSIYNVESYRTATQFPTREKGGLETSQEQSQTDSIQRKLMSDYKLLVHPFGLTQVYRLILIIFVCILTG